MRIAFQEQSRGYEQERENFVANYPPPKVIRWGKKSQKTPNRTVYGRENCNPCKVVQSHWKLICLHCG